MLSSTIVLITTLIGVSYGAVALREPIRNSLEESGMRGTLDKVKMIRHMVSGKCIVIENRKRQGDDKGDKLVLWKCHDKSIKGLEQEMFTFIKSNGGGYLLMGYAGGNDKCIGAGNEYNDIGVTHRCDPNNPSMSWIFRRLDGKRDMYQIIQMSTGRCMRSPVLKNGAWIRVGDCDINEDNQMWRICNLNGSCDF